MRKLPNNLTFCRPVENILNLQADNVAKIGIFVGQDFVGNYVLPDYLALKMKLLPIDNNFSSIDEINTLFKTEFKVAFNLSIVEFLNIVYKQTKNAG